MGVREFIDTNVLVYAEDDSHPDKQEVARGLLRQLLQSRRGVLSLQVLQEFYSAATRKLGMPSEDARRRILLYSRFDLIPFDQSDLLGAIDLHRLHGISFWDALIVRAAVKGSCSILHSEDMQSGRLIESLSILNPFA